MDAQSCSRVLISDLQNCLGHFKWLGHEHRRVLPDQVIDDISRVLGNGLSILAHVAIIVEIAEEVAGSAAIAGYSCCRVCRTRRLASEDVGCLLRDMARPFSYRRGNIVWAQGIDALARRRSHGCRILLSPAKMESKMIKWTNANGPRRNVKSSVHLKEWQELMLVMGGEKPERREMKSSIWAEAAAWRNALKTCKRAANDALQRRCSSAGTALRRCPNGCCGSSELAPYAAAKPHLQRSAASELRPMRTPAIGPPDSELGSLFFLRRKPTTSATSA